MPNMTPNTDRERQERMTRLADAYKRRMREFARQHTGGIDEAARLISAEYARLRDGGDLGERSTAEVLAVAANLDWREDWDACAWIERPEARAASEAHVAKSFAAACGIERLADPKIAATYLAA